MNERERRIEEILLSFKEKKEREGRSEPAGDERLSHQRADLAQVISSYAKKPPKMEDTAALEEIGNIALEFEQKKQEILEENKKKKNETPPDSPNKTDKAQQEDEAYFSNKAKKAHTERFATVSEADEKKADTKLSEEKELRTVAFDKISYQQESPSNEEEEDVKEYVIGKKNPPEKIFAVKIEEEEKPDDLVEVQAEADQEPEKRPIQTVTSEDVDYIENQVNQARQEKIKSFILVGEEEENAPEEEQEIEQDEIIVEEYTGPEAAPTILAGLREVKRTLYLRLFALGITVFLSFVFALILWSAPNPSVFALTSIIIGSCAVVIGFPTVAGGIGNVFRLKFDSNSLPAISLVICMLQAVLLFFNVETAGAAALISKNLYLPLAILGLWFAHLGKVFTINRVVRNFKMLSGNGDKYAVNVVEDEGMTSVLAKGIDVDYAIIAAQKKTGFIENFLDMSYMPDQADAGAGIMAPAVVILSILISAVYCVVGGFGLHDFFTVLAAAIVASCPLCASFCISLPLGMAVKKLFRFGGAIFGYRATEGCGDINTIAVQGYELFPKGSIILQGIKTFSGNRIDDAIIDAASVVCQAKSALRDVFLQVIDNNEKVLKKVDTIVYEDTMGISAWVDNKRVLIGTKDLMNNHGIFTPSKDYEERYLNSGCELIYLSVSGELTAVFIISLTADELISQSLEWLDKNNIYVIVSNCDPFITKEKLSGLFELGESVFRILPASAQGAFEYVTQNEETMSETGICSNGTFVAFSKTVVAAKRIGGISLFSFGVYLAAAILGFCVVAVFVFLQSFGDLSIFTLLLYQAIWLFLHIFVMNARKA